jgi:hypothetical protein
MKTREHAIAFLYRSASGFAVKAVPVFETNGWKWVSLRGATGFGDLVSPGQADIENVVNSLIWNCIKDGGQNACSTGRVTVFLRRTERGDWVSGIQLVAEEVQSY